MLLQNDTFWSQYPFRQGGGAAAGLGSSSMVSFDSAGKITLNRYAGDAGLSKWCGWPIGYCGSYALIQPPHTGGLAVPVSIAGTATLTPPQLAGGRSMAIPSPIAGVGGFLTKPSIDAIGKIVATLASSGNISSATLAGALSAVATLAGHGSFSAGIVGAGQIDATIQGIGTLAALGTAAAAISAAIAGTGSVTPPQLAGGIYIAAAILASGSLSAAVQAPAGIAADILIGASPSASDIAQYVLNDTDPRDLISLREAIRLLTAMAAGKTSIVAGGGGAATVTFRDIRDTLDRIVATMAGSERTAVTLDKT